MTDDGSSVTGDESTVRRWFGDLVDLDEDERNARLRELEQREGPERGDALRARLEALLAADRTIDERLAPYEEAAARILLDVTSSAAPPAASGPDPLGLLGTTMGRYLIGPVLGAGGMGVVYRATDTRLDRPVALKFLTPTLGLEPSAKRRLLREARTAASLDHPNVCTIYEVDDTGDGRLYIAMPSYDGETLRARLERGGIEVAEAVELTIQAARGLAAAHARGLVHRDVKPDNLFLTRDFTVVILDFGIARAAAGGEALTRPGQRPGTEAYMAPEQARGDEAGPAADVFGLGVVLHEMLYGRRPETGNGTDGADGPSADSFPGVPPAVAGLLARMLAADPRARPTAEEVARLDLADLAAGAPGAAPSRATMPGPEATRSVAVLPMSRRWPIGLAMAAGSALVVAAAWLTVGDLRDAPANPGLAEPSSEAQTLATGADPGVAVVPFRAAGVDATVWGTGMVELLSFNFDELQGLRKIDPGTVMTHWRGLERRGTPDSLLAHQVTRATGARYAILGNAVRLSATGDMRLTARVYDAQREGFRGAVRVDGPPDSVNQLIDRLTIEVLRGSLIPLDVERPSVNLSRLTTASLPAMKAYLEGEQAYRRMHWWEAVTHYQTAVELDSTFARAYLRLGQAYNWRDLTSRDVAAAAHARAAELSEALPERDAKLMKLAADRLTRIAELDDFTRAYPDDPDGWFMLADALFHAQHLDVHPERYRRAFERAVRVAPHYAEAYYHLVDDAVVHRDHERVAELATAYDSLKNLGVGCDGLRILHDYLWGSPEARSEAVEAVQTVGFPGISCLWVARAAMGPMMELSEQVQLHPDRVAPVVLWRTMGSRLYNGQPTQAARVLSVAAENPTYRGFEAGNRIMMYLADYTDTLEVERWEQTLRTHSMLGAERDNPAGPVIDYFWIAALALEEGRHDEFEAALASMDSVARTSSQQSGVREERLAAYAVALREFARLADGQWEGLDEFEAALEELVTISTIAEYPSHYMRFEIGKRLLEEGRPREAERYLMSIYPFALPYFVPAQFYLGRAYEELGERDEARERYRLFVEWWEDAEPHLQPWRAEAVEALRRLAPDH